MGTMTDHELVRRGLVDGELLGLGDFGTQSDEEQRDAMGRLPKQGMLVNDMYKRMADHLVLHAPDGVGRVLLEQSVPLGRRWLQVLPYFGRLSLQDYDVSVGLQLRTMCPPHAAGCRACAVIGARLSHGEHCEDRWYRGETLRHDGIRDVLYEHVRRNVHVEVEREARIVADRQERSDLLVRGLHAGPGPWACDALRPVHPRGDRVQGGAERTARSDASADGPAARVRMGVAGVRKARAAEPTGGCDDPVDRHGWCSRCTTDNALATDVADAGGAAA